MVWGCQKISEVEPAISANLISILLTIILLLECYLRVAADTDRVALPAARCLGTFYYYILKYIYTQIYNIVVPLHITPLTDLLTAHTDTFRKKKHLIPLLRKSIKTVKISSLRQGLLTNRFNHYQTNQYFHIRGGRWPTKGMPIV